VNKVERKLDFEVEPSWHPVIAVDESVVKCGGGKTRLCLGGRGRAHEAARLVRRLTHQGNRQRPQIPQRAEGAVSLCVGDPVILTDRGPRYRDAVTRAGFQNHIHQTFGLRSSVERFFGYLKHRTRAFYNNINPKKTLLTPLVDFLELFVHWYTQWR